MKITVSLLLMVGLWRVSVSLPAATVDGVVNSSPGAVSQQQTNVPDYPVGDPRRCFQINANNGLKNDFQTFEVLPGFGWDNLRNVDQGQVVSFNYSQCQTTGDGRFLLPDDVSVVPVKASEVQTSAELITQWTSYTSSSSASVNLDASFGAASFGVSGKFSADYQYVKGKQMEDDSYTTHTALKYPRYEAMLQPYAPLHPAFKKRLLEIAAAHQLKEKKIARYLSQLLVRDYGTHVITSVEAGASLEKLDQIDKTYVEQNSDKKASIKASASASFFSMFSMSMKVSGSWSTDAASKYNNSVTSSKVITRGGPAFMPNNFSLDNWTSQIDSNLVATDRTGDPLHFFVTATNLPELPASTLNEVQHGVKEAVNAYYSHNAIPGCTDRKADNFSPHANVDDGTCKPPVVSLNFGGVYKTCTMTSDSNNGDLCQGHAQKNIITQDFNCPSGYTAVLLNSGQTKTSRTDHVCHSYWLFWKKCHDDYYHSEAYLSMYWCVSTTTQTAGVLFGGVFTSQIDNAVTNGKMCPHKFTAVLVGIESDLQVCVMVAESAQADFMIPFAGFYSCSAGNPLAGNAMRCPAGYSSHLAAVDEGCEIHYCVVTKNLTMPPLTPVKRPPFLPTPPVPAPPTDNLVVFDPVTHTFRRDQAVMMSMVTGTLAETMSSSATAAATARDISGLDTASLTWTIAKNPTCAKTSGLDCTAVSWSQLDSASFSRQQAAPADGTLSPGAISAITAVATCGCILVAMLAVLAVRSRLRRRLHRLPGEDKQLLLAGENRYGAIETSVNLDTSDPRLQTK